MINAAPKQITLKEDGLFYFQADETNPLPGDPVARLVKGGSYLTPQIQILPELSLGDEVRPFVQTALETWLGLHFSAVLSPLVKLTAEIENLPAPVQTICTRLYEGFGILPRAELMEAIAGLDVDMRKTLRARFVRLGPVLVFLAEMTRPAAVKLRALLWSVYHDAPVPAPVPRDGAVSQMIEAADANPAFYQAVGYPLYGGRAIRIDMLDRVITAIYDSVKDNKFQAQHKMAEWLGCSVPDLYKVLEAMGHVKVHDPAEIVESTGETKTTDKVEDAEAAAVEPVENIVVEAPVEVPAPVEGQVAGEDAAPAPAVPEKPVVARPELATFKVFWPRKAAAQTDRAARPRGPRKPKTPPPIEKLSPEELAAKQAEWQARDAAREAARAERAARKDGAGADDKKGPRKFGGGNDKPGERKFGNRRDEPFRTVAPRKGTISKADKTMRGNVAAAASASPADNPFAILATLNFKK